MKRYMFRRLLGHGIWREESGGGMNALDILTEQQEDGGFDELFDGCVPVVIDGAGEWAALVGADTIALCSDRISGTVEIPREIVERLWAAMNRMAEGDAG
jgi:hypothetical protein